MPRPLLTFLSANKLPVAVLAIALAAFLWFGGHFLANAIYFNDPRHRDQPLEAWMTPRYVALSYGLPREVMIDTLQLPPGKPDKRLRISDVAVAMGVSLEELTAIVRAAADAHRRSRP